MAKLTQSLGPDERIGNSQWTASEWARMSIELLHTMGIASDGETLNMRFRCEEWIRDWNKQQKGGAE